MRILKPVLSALQKLQWWKKPEKTPPDQHLRDADFQIQTLLSDTSIPAAIKQELFQEFEDIESISGKLQNGEIHISVFGRVGTGKSSLLNALMGQSVFSTSPLHGETQFEQRGKWDTVSSDHVVFIDTPGIDEIDGETREDLARSVARMSDIILMVCEGDLTDMEFTATRELTLRNRPLLLVLNKSDRYNRTELHTLVEHLRQRCAEFLPASNIITTSADPRPEPIVRIDASGEEHAEKRSRQPMVEELQLRLWDILEKEGKSLSALNAAMFVNELDGRIAQKIVLARKTMANRIIRNYCLVKGLAVAVNPVPVADLLAAAGTDIAMARHLGSVYGFQLSKREASGLLVTISAQLLLLMGAYWGVNMVSSALKTLSAGLTTALTAGAQGTLAWYATYVTGLAIESWFAKGKSWGNSGPKQTIQNILSDLDRNSILLSAREDIITSLKKGGF